MTIKSEFIFPSFLSFFQRLRSKFNDEDLAHQTIARMDGGIDPYNKRYAVPCCATAQAVLGVLVGGCLILCFASYEIGGWGMLGLLLAITGTILESWAAYSSFKNPRKAQKKRIVFFLFLIVAGTCVFIAAVTVKDKWTIIVQTGVGLIGVVILTAAGVVIWAFKLPNPNKRVEPPPAVEDTRSPSVELEPPPMIANALDDPEKIVEIRYLTPFAGIEKVEQWEKWDKSGEGDVGIAQNLPTGEPIEFPACPYEDVLASDEPLDIV